MATRTPTGAPEVVKDLADAFSTQVRLSNKIWLLLIVAATVVVFPNVEKEMVRLPFSLGVVDTAIYKVVGYFILTILMLSYCQAYAGAHVATRFVHSVIDAIEPKQKRREARIFFDFLVHSSLARVAFLAELTASPLLATAYYIVLKVVANSVMIGIPAAALLVAFFQIVSSETVHGAIKLISFLVLGLSAIAIAQILRIEAFHSLKVAKLFWLDQAVRKKTLPS